ncbi:MAG: apolipoprotein N-acyltransferase [bacterium]|nr:apolipoprotein N-acyltransferase [bacterium]
MENRKTVYQIALAILSGILLRLSYPTVPFANLAWIALVPLFLAIENQPIKRTALFGFITGYIYFYSILYWLNLVARFSWLVIPGLIVLAGYLALYFTAAVVLLNWLVPRQCGLRVVVAAALWVGLEYFRQVGQFGFAWGILGYTQWNNLPMIQLATLTSVLGLSFLIVFVNASLSYFISAIRNRIPFKKLIALVIIISGMFISVYWYGNRQMELNNRLSGRKTIRVAVVQGNIPQELKWDETKLTEYQEIHFRLTESAIAQYSPELVIWPETAITEPIRAHPELVTRFQRLAKQNTIHFLIGSPDVVSENGKEKLFNSAVQISADHGIINTYDKTVLVPFGEYVPFSDFVPILKHIIQGPGDFSPGNRPTQFTLLSRDSTPFSFTAVICFESTMAQLVRRFMRNPVDFLVIITNDAWFGNSEAPYQHAYMAVFRAVENRTYIARAANTGYSCFINPFGQILAGRNLGSRGVLVYDIQPRQTRTFYTQYGDIFAYLCMFYVVVIAGSTLRQNRKDTSENQDI